MECFVCGKRFRSLALESVHRHNFPAMCNQNSKMFKEWMKKRELEKDK